jgi:hypothetical protein
MANEGINIIVLKLKLELLRFLNLLVKKYLKAFLLRMTSNQQASIVVMDLRIFFSLSKSTFLLTRRSS